MKSILDPTFQYVPSAQTDLRKTFRRVRKELAQANGVRPSAEPKEPDPPKIIQIRRA